MAPLIRRLCEACLRRPCLVLLLLLLMLLMQSSGSSSRHRHVKHARPEFCFAALSVFKLRRLWKYTTPGNRHWPDSLELRHYVCRALQTPRPYFSQPNTPCPLIHLLTCRSSPHQGLAARAQYLELRAILWKSVRTSKSLGNDYIG